MWCESSDSLLVTRQKTFIHQGQRLRRLWFGEQGKMPIFSGEQGNRYPAGRASTIVHLAQLHQWVFYLTWPYRRDHTISTPRAMKLNKTPINNKIRGAPNRLNETAFSFTRLLIAFLALSKYGTPFHIASCSASDRHGPENHFFFKSARVWSSFILA